MKKLFNKTAFTTILVLIIVSLVSYALILYGEGYRLNLNPKSGKIIAGTGLLVLTSTPDGARVYLNNELTTATDNTMNLPPGEYDVRIEKDGYYTWKKHVIVKKEAVTKTDAILFPTTPKLEAVTLLGAQDPVVDPTGSFIAYKVSSSSAQNNGIYLLSLEPRSFISLGSSSRQIVSDTFDSFSKAEIKFSPDGQQILATIPGTASTSASATSTNRIYLLRTDSFNDNPANVTFTVAQVKAQWDVEQEQKDDKFQASLPPKARKFIMDNFSNINISPEGDKIEYTASNSAVMPQFINPPVLSTNSTPETRTLKKGDAFVYQLKEDKNYLLYDVKPGEELPNFIWYPSSAHLIFIKDKRIFIIEYDGGNTTTLYAGPFDPNFLYAWPDSSGLVILTNFNDESVPANLYRVGLR